MVDKHCPNCGCYAEQIDVYKLIHYVLVFYCKQCDAVFEYMIEKELEQK